MLLPAAEMQMPAVERPHPGDTALSQDKNGVWQYKSFPQLGTLYVSSKDGPEKSNCDVDCSQVWPPLISTKHKVGQQVGDWKVFARDDGYLQWAYKGKPVYTRFHNASTTAAALEKEGFQILEP
jgi:predicted lipoprotein with Yx(FWY)xxD motif